MYSIDKHLIGLMKYNSRYYLSLALCLKISNSLFCLDLYLHNCSSLSLDYFLRPQTTPIL